MRVSLRGGRRWDARARPWAQGRAGFNVARAPPGLPSPPPPCWCARADTGRGGGVRGARVPAPHGAACVARRGGAEVSRFTGTRARREHAVSKLDPGAAEEKRASGLGARAPHPRAVPVSASPSRGRRVCREQVVGMPAPRRGWGAGVRARAPGIRGLLAGASLSVHHGGHGPASERASERMKRAGLPAVYTLQRLERRCRLARAHTLRSGRSAQNPGRAGPSAFPDGP